MLYLAYALLGHVGNAFVFIIDKTLLTGDNRISNPLRMAYYTGLLSILAVVLLPFVPDLPTVWLLTWSTIASAFFLGALWVFFAALKTDEPTRVVPVIGSAVPLFTLLFAVAFLGERLTGLQILGVIVLIVGGVLLSISIKGVRGLSRQTIWLTLFGGILFAAHFATIKYIYNGYPSFLGAFMYSRLTMTLVAVLFMGPLLWILKKSPRPRRQKSAANHQKTAVVTSLFIGNKALGAGTVLLQNYAISLGSVTVVNALQGTQYLVLLVLAIAVSRWWPHLWAEELKRVALWQKLSGIILVSSGLALILI
ncbi:hypothetical protein CL628_03820 [bacterium]|nr:hypothetical protein [bacterium]